MRRSATLSFESVRRSVSLSFGQPLRVSLRLCAGLSYLRLGFALPPRLVRGGGGSRIFRRLNLSDLILAPAHAKHGAPWRLQVFRVLLASRVALGSLSLYTGDR